MAIRVWLASLLLALAPVVASAVTLPAPAINGLNDGEIEGVSFFGSAGDKYIYVNEDTLPLRIFGFGLTFTNALGGVAGFDAIDNSSWAFTGPGGPLAATFTPVAAGSAWLGMASIPDFVLAVGEQFHIEVSLVQPGTAGGFSFSTAAVPLPAAGWMLISAIGGLTILARRRKAVA